MILAGTSEMNEAILRNEWDYTKKRMRPYLEMNETILRNEWDHTKKTLGLQVPTINGPASERD